MSPRPLCARTSAPMPATILLVVSMYRCLFYLLCFGVFSRRGEASGRAFGAWCKNPATDPQASGAVHHLHSARVCWAAHVSGVQPLRRLCFWSMASAQSLYCIAGSSHPCLALDGVALELLPNARARHDCLLAAWPRRVSVEPGFRLLHILHTAAASCATRREHSAAWLTSTPLVFSPFFVVFSMLWRPFSRHVSPAHTRLAFWGIRIDDREDWLASALQYYGCFPGNVGAVEDWGRCLGCSDIPLLSRLLPFFGV